MHTKKLKMPCFPLVLLLLCYATGSDDINDNVSNTNNATSSEPTTTLDPITTVGTARTQSWPPYASVHSGSQYFYSPPNYGKELGRPALSFRSKNTPFSQRFNGFSESQPPTVYEDYDYSSTPMIDSTETYPDITFEPTQITPEYSEYSTSESTFFDAGYDLPLYSSESDNLPTYEEPVLTPLTGFKESTESSDENVKVYNMYFYNDGKNSKKAEKYSHKVPEKRPNNRQKFNAGGPKRQKFDAGGPKRQKFNAGGPKRQRFRKMRRPMKPKRPPMRYRHPPNFYPHPPSYRPPKRFRGKFGNEDDGQEMADPLLPIGALTALIPLGIALALIAPTAIPIIGKKKRRKRSMQVPNGLRQVDQIENMMADQKCLQKMLCESIAQAKKGRYKWSSFLSTFVFSLLTNQSYNTTRYLRARDIAKAISSRNCNKFICSVKKRS